MPGSLPDPEEQIRAILTGNTFNFAHDYMPEGKSIDDIRFRDLISVDEDEVFAYVVKHGFDERIVSEPSAHPLMDDDTICIVPEPDGRWRVFNLERGQCGLEEVLPSLAAARKHVVHRLVRSARVSLNHRFRLAHPELDLPLPSEME